MANVPDGHSAIGRGRSLKSRAGQKQASIRWGLLAAACLAAQFVVAQGVPRVTGIEPNACKVNDSVTVKGENLSKATVADAYLSDDKNDYKATIVDQSPDKIVIKIPDVKPGDYNVSIQVGKNIFIQPVRLKVQ